MRIIPPSSVHIDTVLSHAADPALAPLGQGFDPLISRSWQRCIRDYGLDPAKPAPPRFVPRQVLLDRKSVV